jgi:3-oxoacyl-[acyl-carrier-protein] synthase II
VLGEGAAFVVLESLEHASARGVEPYAVIRGHASTADPGLLVGDASDAEALEQAARRALGRADVAPRELGAVFGDGLGTEVDDIRESTAVAHLVEGAETPIAAPTAAIGYTGAASGVFSLVHAAVALRRGLVPPLRQCEDRDPRCPVHVLSDPAPLDRDAALVWNSERGVKNVAVVAARPA